jgi:hypothetical protein
MPKVSSKGVLRRSHFVAYGTGLVKSHKYYREKPKTKDNRPSKPLNLSP